MYFILFHEKIRAEKVVYLFKQHIIVNHEVSTEIISDRNTYNNANNIRKTSQKNTNYIKNCNYLIYQINHNNQLQ